MAQVRNVLKLVFAVQLGLVFQQQFWKGNGFVSCFEMLSLDDLETNIKF